MDDLISRQTVLEKINERQRKLIYCFGFENDAVKIMDIAKSIITAIPPVQPDLSGYSSRLWKAAYERGKAEGRGKRKKGHWIPQDHNKSNGMVSTAVFYYPKCSECDHSGSYDMNFCPNCGAKMEKPEDDIPMEYFESGGR